MPPCCTAPSVYAIWRLLGLCVPEQRAHWRRRVVDQGLLVSVEHLIPHGSDEGVGLALTTGAQLCQSVHDRLGDRLLLRRGHQGPCRSFTYLRMCELRINQLLDVRRELLA